MIKKAGLLISGGVLFLLMLMPVMVQAQSQLTIKGTSAEANYPFQLNFTLSAESDVPITDIRLHFSLERDSFADVTSEIFIAFLPDTELDITWTWDMRTTGGLPPGASLEYWWTVKDADGDVITSQPVQVIFHDNRYDWQSLTKDKVTIYWYEGRKSFAEDLMSATTDALDRLTRETGAFLKRPVKLYVYADSDDLRGAMIFPQDWTGGAAYTSYGIIAIGIGPSSLNWGERAIAHEITHLVVHQMTFNPYSGLPTWLEEGLAMYSEGELQSGFKAYLERAIEDDLLITVRSLSSPFSAISEASYLSYAQSQSIIDYLIGTYGQNKMLELLNTFSKGTTYDNALEQVYGFDMDGLNELWRGWALPDSTKSGIETAGLTQSGAVK